MWRHALIHDRVEALGDWHFNAQPTGKAERCRCRCGAFGRLADVRKRIPQRAASAKQFAEAAIARERAIRRGDQVADARKSLERQWVSASGDTEARHLCEATCKDRGLAVVAVF